MNSEYIKKFIQQKSNIEYYTVILCQTKEDFKKAEQWLSFQKRIPYLPKEDIFAYYCPICNNILDLNKNCNQCKQVINWVFHNSCKPIKLMN